MKFSDIVERVEVLKKFLKYEATSWKDHEKMVIYQPTTVGGLISAQNLNKQTGIAVAVLLVLKVKH